MQGRLLCECALNYKFQGVPFSASVPAVEQSSDRMEIRILIASG